MRTPVKNFRISAQVLHVPKTAKNAKVFGGRGVFVMRLQLKPEQTVGHQVMGQMGQQMWIGHGSVLDPWLDEV